MRIKIMSDLHTESYPDRFRDWIRHGEHDNADVLVLAGDICTYRNARPVLEAACDRYPHVVYTMGNHEHWGYHHLKVYEQMNELDEELDNLHWMDRDCVDIDGINFIGATLWFPRTYTSEELSRDWSDFRRIPSAQDFIWERAAVERAFLRGAVRAGDVVVTHHAPSWMSVHPKYAGDPTNCFYVHDCEDFIQEAKPALWIHGHMHSSFDYQLGQTRVICNPQGYGSENHFQFTYNKIVEV